VPVYVGGSTVRKNGVAAWRQGAGIQQTSAGGDRTAQQQIPYDRKFTGVRLVYANYYPSGPATLTTVKVAVAPIDGSSGNTLTWTPVTWAGAASITLPAAVGSANNYVPSVAFSDFIPITAISRTDIPTAPYLLLVRGYDAALIVAGGPVNTAGAAQWLADRGYVYRYGVAVSAGAIVADTTAITTAATSGLGVINAVEFYGAGDALTFYVFGDSLTAGYSGNAAGYQSGWPNMLDYMWRTSGKIGGCANWACGGMTQQKYIDTMKAVCTANAPSAAYFSPYSPNTGSATQAIWDLQYAIAAEAIAWLIARGIHPVISTALPSDSLNATQDGYRKAFNARLKADYALNCTVLDLAPVVEDPNDSSKQHPLMKYDNVHFNDVGHQACANYIYANLAF
jgi:hypothetical protein